MIDIVMPQMGESIVEGTLTKWLKKPGDKASSVMSRCLKSQRTKSIRRFRLPRPGCSGICWFRKARPFR